MKIAHIRYFWEGKNDRHYYKSDAAYTPMHMHDHVWTPKNTIRILATVTRDTKTTSPTFNRWYAQVGTKNKSEPLMSLADAKAWVEVVERMTR